MADIYLNPTLIDFSYFSAYSPVPNNFNWDDIRPFVSIAEEVWVVDILGRKLYNELLEQVQNNNLTGENSTLLLKIYPYLSMAIVFESMPFLAYNITEKGVTKGKSDNSEPISNSELINMQNHIRTQLEVLKRMLKNFLNENSDCYPLFKSDDDCCTTTDIDDCGAFALFLWNANRIDVHREMKWYNFYQKMKQNPNANIRLYSNNSRILR
jgi:hypothetical protein